MVFVDVVVAAAAVDDDGVTLAGVGAVADDVVAAAFVVVAAAVVGLAAEAAHTDLQVDLRNHDYNIPDDDFAIVHFARNHSVEAEYVAAVVVVVIDDEDEKDVEVADDDDSIQWQGFVSHSIELADDAQGYG